LDITIVNLENLFKAKPILFSDLAKRARSQVFTLRLKTMKTRAIGNMTVSAIGLGCMNVSWGGGTALDPKTRQESAIPGIHAALDAGITLLDTADIYAPTWNSIGHNERFVAEALESWGGTSEQKAKVVVATKAGIARRPGEIWGRNGSLDYLLRAAEASAGRLKVDRIALWQHHRLDPSIPLETQIENLFHLKEHGVVENVGVSNYNAKELEIAVKIGGTPKEGGIVSIQNELSPRYRHDIDVLEVCEKYGIAFLPWSPLGGAKNKGELSTGQSIFETIAEQRSVSPFVVALSWLLKLSPVIIPIPGATRAESATDSASAAGFELSDAEFEKIQSSLPESAPISSELTPHPPLRS
jgi:aryl-alcohol dehydrogenase-like predicted oxidoreductase